MKIDRGWTYNRTLVTNLQHSVLSVLSVFIQEENLDTPQPNLALDVSLEKARALHRVWRALNDGDCPKCHHAVAATDVIRPNLKGGIWLKCPNPDCGFYVTGQEITEIELMFAPAMDAAVAIFERWRESRSADAIA